MSLGSAFTHTCLRRLGWAHLIQEGLGASCGTALRLSPAESWPPCSQARTHESVREGLSPGVHAQEAAGGPAEGDRVAWGLPGIHRAAPGKGPTILSPASSPHTPRRRQTEPPWRRRFGTYGTTTGGCRPRQRAQPPACSWPPSSWAPPPPTWPELSGPALAWLWSCSELPRSFRALGSHRALGPPQELSLRRGAS